MKALSHIPIWILSLALSLGPLHELVPLSPKDGRYSHLILIPVLSALFSVLEIRIVTLWLLGTRVNLEFFYGILHHNGGVLFGLLSLAILLGFLAIMRTLERRDPASKEVAATTSSGR